MQKFRFFCRLPMMRSILFMSKINRKNEMNKQHEKKKQKNAQKTEKYQQKFKIYDIQKQHSLQIFYLF